MSKFVELTRVLRHARDRHFLRCAEPAEALEETDDCLAMLKSNFEEDDDVEVRLESAANLIGATLAVADLLMQSLSLDDIEALIATHRASEALG